MVFNAISGRWTQKVSRNIEKSEGPSDQSVFCSEDVQHLISQECHKKGMLMLNLKDSTALWSVYYRIRIIRL